MAARILLALASLSIFAINFGQGSHISCGKSFVPCENDDATIPIVSAASIHPRVYGISSAQFHRQQVPEPLVRVTANEAMREVHQIMNETIEPYIDSKLPLAASIKQFCHLHPMSSKAKAFSEAAYVSSLMALRLKNLGLRESEISAGLDPKVLMKSALGTICPRQAIETCTDSEYRTPSGDCNNVKNPLWGTAFEPFQRLTSAYYSDGIQSIKDSKTRQTLPNTRELSSNLFENPSTEQTVVNEMVPFWLYFVASDLGEIIPNQYLAPFNNIFKPFPCCDSSFIHPDCLPIHVPSNDFFYSRGNVSCLPYTRSLPAPRNLCKLGHREQINTVTSFLDASMIYGSSKEQQEKLRTSDGGLMITSSYGSVADLLPQDTQSNDYCQSTTRKRCFLSGTSDTNILPEISAMHMLFVRQHNYLAKAFKNLNRHWSDEKLFQEARKIVVAQIQHITFSEFLPVLIGHDNIKEYDLKVKDSGYSADYDVEIDSTTLNEFSTIATTAAFSLLNGRRRKAISERFNNPDELYDPEGIEKAFYHMSNDPAEIPGLKLSTEFRGKFLKSRNAKVGLDLGTIALMQARDHGLPSYTQMRRQCGLSRAYTFHDLQKEFLNESLPGILSQHYESVEDIDLLIGVLAEKPKKGSFIGATLSCIIGNQMYRTKAGDRYWYENYFAASAFTDEQLSQIRQTTLSKLVCGLTTTETIQVSSFLLPDNFDNSPIDCKSNAFKKMDLSLWKETQQDLQLPITQETIQKVVKIAQLNLEDQKKREIGNIRKNQGTFQKGDPLFAYANMMRAKAESKEVSKVSALLLETTRILLRGEPLPDGEKLPALDIESLQQILPQIDVSHFVNNFTAFLSEDGQSTKDDCLPKMLPCDHTTRYRTYSGWCNNLKSPNFGNAFTPLRHLMQPVYDDGFDAPRSKAKSGALLPSAREISNAVHVDRNITHVKFTHMVMQFGQFVDHELTHSPTARGPNDEILNCTKCDSPQTISVHCMPLKIQPNDPFFPAHLPDGTPRCLPFARSLLGQLSLGYRNQLNQLTAYVDGSVIYGSTLCEANNLRLFRNGLMNFTDLGDGNHEALPQGNQEKDCRSLPHSPCFVAGDERNSHQPGLTVMHTLFLREHNRLATTLSKINPHWTDEKLFQEARRIQIAQLQHIVFDEFVPKLIGQDLLHEYDLVPLKTGYYDGYDPTCDAAISHPFATAAYRFGHTLVRRLFPRMDLNYKKVGQDIDLSQHFGHVGPVYNTSEGGIDTMIMGLLGTPSMAFDRHITSAVRNQLFARRGEPKSGLDLISLNILRARDHGVQSYNSFRSLCGLKKAVSFDDLYTEMDSEAINALKQIYDHVDDIDLFPGITSERPRKGALLGTTMSCLIAEQFRRLKKCDRFYYENSNSAAKFSVPQLQEIRKMSLAKILCQTSKYIKTIQPHVFDMPDELMNAQVRCEDLEGMNLEHWKENSFCQMNGLVVAAGETKAITPCVTCTCTAEGMECHPRRIVNCEKLLNQYRLSAIQKDTACLIQCSEYLRNTGKEL